MEVQLNKSMQYVKWLWHCKDKLSESSMIEPEVKVELMSGEITEKKFITDLGDMK